MSIEKDFIDYQAQVTYSPIGIRVSHAEGCYIYGKNGKKYLDFTSGMSVNILGHNNKMIINYVKKQVNKHLHTMVYGEFIHDVCVKLCKKISKIIPYPLTTTYLVNSGTEAVEGALKLAKAYSGRNEIISCNNSYHGSTHGSLSLMSKEDNKRIFRPLLPLIKFINFNKKKDIKLITNNTACIIMETIQCSSGVILPDPFFLKEVRYQCTKNKVIMILNEIQTGFGRTGKLFSFEHYGIIPDILIIGKGMGGGMPISAFVSSKKIMKIFCRKKPLGHITTFGGHPLSAAASLATINQITKNKSYIIKNIFIKEQLIRKYLVHPKIKNIYGIGLLLAIELYNKHVAKQLLKKSVKKGLILFSFLFCDKIIRITPQLNITKNEIKKGCMIIIEILNQIKID